MFASLPPIIKLRLSCDDDVVVVDDFRKLLFVVISVAETLIIDDDDVSISRSSIKRSEDGNEINICFLSKLFMV